GGRARRPARERVVAHAGDPAQPASVDPDDVQLTALLGVGLEREPAPVGGPPHRDDEIDATHADPPQPARSHADDCDLLAAGEGKPPALRRPLELSHAPRDAMPALPVRLD